MTHAFASRERASRLRGQEKCALIAGGDHFVGWERWRARSSRPEQSLARSAPTPRSGARPALGRTSLWLAAAARRGGGPLLLVVIGLVALVGAARFLRVRGVHALGQPSLGGALQTGGGDDVTNIALDGSVLQSGVERFGINLSGQSFYDSGMMLKNLVARNPGFEGETWQSIVRCKSVTRGIFTDENAYAAWRDGFFDGARYEVLSGPATGKTGVVRGSSAASGGTGGMLALSDAPAALASGSFLLLSIEKAGGADAGWWTQTSGGASVTTEFHDLSPETPGRQALRVDAAGAGQTASVSSYFDSTEGHSFLQLHGRYALRFRAKRVGGVTGKEPLTVSFSREDKRRGTAKYLQKEFALTSAWQNVAVEFPAEEDGRALGTLALSFAMRESAVLLDDVELVPLGGDRENRTAFRDEVVEALRALHPGVIRFMDNGTSFGSTFDDLIAPPFARRRAGVFSRSDKQEDIPIGLDESLGLAAALHADPWYTLPATTSPVEAAHLMEYLAGPADSPYGARRVARGHAAPWTSEFKTIHLELGDEMWNAGSFGGASLADPTAYAARANAVFGAIRASTLFHASGFDLVLGAQAENTWLTAEELKTSRQQDSIDFAPYLLSQFNDASSSDAVFGPLLGEPESEDIGGVMAQQIAAVRRLAPATKASIYEVNLGTAGSTNDSVTQRDLDETVPSLGAGLAVADHMLLMLRELGIRTQCLFALPEFANGFRQPGGSAKTVPLWGSVVDMGGATNRRRPVYYALELANEALLANELTARVSGANPTWEQPASANDSLPAMRPHLIQSFAFGEGDRRSLVLLNLSRSASLPVTFSGVGKPGRTVDEARLTSAKITDGNETEARVKIARKTLNGFHAETPYRLPPYSLTVLNWKVSP